MAPKIIKISGSGCGKEGLLLDSSVKWSTDPTKSDTLVCEGGMVFATLDPAEDGYNGLFLFEEHF